MNDAQGIQLIHGDKVAFTSTAIHELTIGTVYHIYIGDDKFRNEPYCDVIYFSKGGNDGKQAVRESEIVLIPDP